MGSMSAYKAGGRHRHTPEIEQALTEVLYFIPNGLVIPARHDLLHPGARPDAARHPRYLHGPADAAAADSPDPDSALRGAFADAYAGEPFVHLLPAGQWPVTGAVAGSNGAHVQVTADPHAGRAVVVAATDNLGKGAAGQAVQIANLMLGLPETAGLHHPRSRPMSVTAPQGFRAAGVAGRAEGSPATGTSRW